MPKVPELAKRPGDDAKLEVTKKETKAERKERQYFEKRKADQENDNNEKKSKKVKISDAPEELIQSPRSEKPIQISASQIINDNVERLRKSKKEVQYEMLGIEFPRHQRNKK